MITTSQKRSISFLICALAALMITSCSDPVQPELAPTIRLDSALPKVIFHGKEFMVFGRFSSVDPNDYRATIEGLPCTIRAISQSRMIVLPHPNILGATYLTVAARVAPDQHVRLSQRLYIVDYGQPFDTTTTDSVYYLDPLLKVTNPGSAYFVEDFHLNVRGFDLPADSFVVTIGPLIISNSNKANSLIKAPNGLTIPAGLLDLADGTYPVTVSIPTQSRFASGKNITIGPLSIAGPKEQVYPGDTLTFDRYYPDLSAVINNVRYSEGDPVRKLWRDGSSERMRVGPILSLAEGLTNILFVSIKTGRIVGTSTMNSSQQRTEDLMWTPQQQYAGRTIEITFPWISAAFELKSCMVGNAWTQILSSSPTTATLLLGPNVKREGIFTLTFHNAQENTQIVINSRDPFIPLTRGTPPVPTVRLRMDLVVPGNWHRRRNGETNTTTEMESFTVDLLNPCGGQWCDTNITNTYIAYGSSTISPVGSTPKVKDSTNGTISFDGSLGSVRELRANHFHSEVQTSHNTNYDRYSNLSLELENMGVATRNGNGSYTIKLTGDEAFRAIRTLKYAYTSSTRVSGGEIYETVTLLNLEPSLASQCAITLTFTQ